MSAPAIIWLILAGIGLIVAAAKHGRPTIEQNNVWTSIIGVGITAGLLAWGGFFGPVG